MCRPCLCDEECIKSGMEEGEGNGQGGRALGKGGEGEDSTIVFNQNFLNAFTLSTH